MKFNAVKPFTSIGGGFRWSVMYRENARCYLSLGRVYALKCQGIVGVSFGRDLGVTKDLSQGTDTLRYSCLSLSGQVLISSQTI